MMLSSNYNYVTQISLMQAPSAPKKLQELLRKDYNCLHIRLKLPRIALSDYRLILLSFFLTNSATNQMFSWIYMCVCIFIYLKPVCICVVTTTKKPPKRQSLSDELSYSFNT